MERIIKQELIHQYIAEAIEQAEQYREEELKTMFACKQFEIKAYKRVLINSVPLGNPEKGGDLRKWIMEELPLEGEWWKDGYGAFISAAKRMQKAGIPENEIKKLLENCYTAVADEFGGV